ncbi:lipoate--protein ligase [Pseudoalteromonas sp. MMG013]|uniref:lipoate--protein ligase family protein n=1 Tax=Pseudoalteromonas sp. MMG013 TaxID=2822687 RepID=UPI001B368F74|nr:lipoate--protein ligase [Pseudoalteromonas sp. MMG013]MBQ4861606.1 lipoate--protein ligase [Pseudoalteromonas sp. MMG013]
MEKTRIKLLRYNDIAVSTVFDKEAALLAQLQTNTLDQSLILWRTKVPTLVLPAGNKWPMSSSLESALSEIGWQLFTRKTGGAPVPQTDRVINVSHLYHWPTSKPYSIVLAYQYLCRALTGFLASFGITCDVHATPGSYCDGDYNLNIAGKKIIGTAQRVVVTKGGGRIVLAQACILIDALMEELVKPVNLCYTHCGYQELIKADVHTSLFEHIDERLNVDMLFSKLQQAFIDSQLYSSFE